MSVHSLRTTTPNLYDAGESRGVETKEFRSDLPKDSSISIWTDDCSAGGVETKEIRGSLPKDSSINIWTDDSSAGGVKTNEFFVGPGTENENESPVLPNDIHMIDDTNELSGFEQAIVDCLAQESQEQGVVEC